MATDRRTEAPAEVVLLRDGVELWLGPAEQGDRCDLGLVDDLLQLQLALRRFGWDLRLDRVPPRLVELVELIGLHDEIAGA